MFSEVLYVPQYLPSRLPDADQQGFGDNGEDSTRPSQSGHGHDQMTNRIAKSRIPAMVSTLQKTPHLDQFGNSPSIILAARV
jgi:hypothetical protein